MAVIEGSIPRGAGVITGPGKDWYVNANTLSTSTPVGSDSNSGDAWSQAFKTMQQALDSVASGDRIHVVGKVTEEVSTPVSIFDVSIIGHGTRVRHIDGTAVLGSERTAMWGPPASPTASTPLLIIRQQGWVVEGILFDCPVDAAAIQLLRNGDSGNDERDGSHATIRNCRFANGQDAIEQSGGAHHIVVEDCYAEGMTGWVFKDTVGAGIGYPVRWKVRRNHFYSNANVLKMACQDWEILDNSILTTTTEVLDTDKGDAQSGRNVVVRNSFNIAAAAFDPAGNVEGNSTDVWSNYLADGIESGEPAD